MKKNQHQLLILEYIVLLLQFQSIFDDYDILCRTQTQTLPENEFSSFSSIDPIPLNSTLQFTQEEEQNLNDFGHFQDQKQRHQVGIET